MMRKSILLSGLVAIIIIVIASIFISGFTGCTDAYGTKYYVSVEGHPEASFIYIPRSSDDHRILVYNEKTKVMYLAPPTADNYPLTLVVDENGNPAIWEE